MTETDAAFVFDALDARRTTVTFKDGLAEDVLGLFIRVQRRIGGEVQLVTLPEILVPLRTALDMPVAIQSALTKYFPEAIAPPPSGPGSSGTTPAGHH